MPGPGEYRPDSTVGIDRPEDLPKTKISVHSRNYRRRPCPRCGHGAYRDRIARRILHDLGNPFTGRPRDIVLLRSQHYCRRCRKYFNADSSDLADPGSHYTRRVVDTGHPAGRRQDGLHIARPLWATETGAITACSSPSPRSRTGSRPGGKKAARRIDTEHLDWALSDFSGYIAADELYDGPFCILSIVDNRTFKRLTYQVLDHDPTHVDITAFFRRFHSALEARGLAVAGITTDGSPLYPGPIAAVFGEIPHQLCTFHVLREVTKAVLSAVAQERKRLAATMPKLPRGRPRADKAARAMRPGVGGDQAVCGRRLVRPPLPVRPEALEPLRASGAAADHPRVATAPALARADGRGLPTVRSAVPNGHGGAIAGGVALRLRRSCRLRSVLKKLMSPGLEKAARCSWTSGSWGRRPTRWSGATGGTGRCRMRCTGCGRNRRSRTGWRWICCGRVRRRAGRVRPRPCTRPERRDFITRFPCYSVGFSRFFLQGTLHEFLKSRGNDDA